MQFPCNWGHGFQALKHLGLFWPYMSSDSKPMAQTSYVILPEILTSYQIRQKSMWHPWWKSNPWPQCSSRAAPESDSKYCRYTRVRRGKCVFIPRGAQHIIIIFWIVLATKYGLLFSPPVPWKFLITWWLGCHYIIIIWQRWLLILFFFDSIN